MSFCRHSNSNTKISYKCGARKRTRPNNLLNYPMLFETQGQAQVHVETLYLCTGLGTPRNPQWELVDVAREREVWGPCLNCCLHNTTLHNSWQWTEFVIETVSRLTNVSKVFSADLFDLVEAGIQVGRLFWQSGDRSHVRSNLLTVHGSG